MQRLVLDIDAETFARLLDLSLRERRPLPSQGSVTLRKALGLPFPEPTTDLAPPSPAAEPVTRAVAPAGGAS